MPRPRSESSGSLIRTSLIGLVAFAASPIAGSESLETILAPHRTEAQLSLFAQDPPESCLDIDASTRLCSWKLGGNQAAWEDLASEAQTRDRINLICELPSDGGERDHGSCAVYPRRSNRDDYRPTSGGRPAAKRIRRSAGRNESSADLRAEAEALMRAMEDLRDVVALAGVLPEQCSGEVSAERACRWRLNNHTQGHGTAAASAGIPRRQQVILICLFDSETRLRGDDACRVRTR